MKCSRKNILFLIISIEFILIASTGSLAYLINNTDSGNVQAAEGAGTVIITREQYFYKNDTVHSYAYVYWSELKDGILSLYGNTSAAEMFYYKFWDAIGPYEEDRIEVFPDRIQLTMRTTELYYEIYGAYHPDYFLDTNFIVLFDTYWAQFSYITPEGEERYAPVNYYNKQLLPEGAALVSFAPTDGATIIKEGESYGIVWEFTERAMDPFHEPFPYEITYNFDPIFLAFTEQMYQNQQERQKNEAERNFLDLLRTYFKIIAFLAVILSLVAAIIGYLRARQKMKTKLDQARNMPKRMLKDIEAEKEPSKRVSSLFNVGFIFLLLSAQLFTAAVNPDTPLADMSNSTGIELEGLTPLNAENRNIDYETIIDLRKDGLAFETVVMELPYSVANFSIWANTENVIEFQAYDQSGLPVSHQEFSDHYLIIDVDGYIRYEIIRPYIYHNNSNILVYIDYFWLNFFDETLGEFSKADISYTVILPEEAILYSASPEDKLTLSLTPEGRKKITFTDFDRSIDPYHDLFSSQVTFSYIDVLEAIENQSARFEHFRVETELTEEQISALTKNVLFLALLAIIAPILAFLLSYYIMRQRLMKKIQEEEQKHELLISVEEIQIQSLKKAQDIDLDSEPWKAMLGGYWELLAYLSRYTPVSLLNMKEDRHEKTIRKYIPSFLITETLDLLSTGRALVNSWMKEEQMFYNRSQARDYVEAIMKLIEKMEKQRKEMS